MTKTNNLSALPEVALQIMRDNHAHAIREGIAMDHREWNRSETFQYFGYLLRNVREDGFPVFVKCGIVEHPV